MSVETFDPTALITMTPQAIKHFEGKLKDHPGHVIRLSTKLSGCTGFAYVLERLPEPHENDDVVVISPSLKVAVAQDALDILRNTEIDYVLEGVNGVIKYHNPNVVDACGCGESFNVG